MTIDGKSAICVMLLVFASAGAEAQSMRRSPGLDAACPAAAKPEDIIQIQINHMRADIDRDYDQSDVARKAARDRKKASLDNIQKLLDIIRGMNPQI